MKDWVLENLSDILGLRDQTLAEYVLAISQNCTSSGQIFQLLLDNAFPNNGSSKRFAIELFNRMNTAPRVATAPQNPQKSNAQLLRESAAYKLVPTELESHGSKRADPSRNSSQTSTIHKKGYIRRRFGSDDDEEEEILRVPLGDESSHNKRLKRYEETLVEGRKLNSVTEEVTSMVAEEEDQEERVAFEKRLAERDAKNTKRIGGSGSEPAPESGSSSFAALVNAPPAERDAALQELRKLSRRTYLEKREKRELQLLEEQLAWDERMYKDWELTPEELATRNYNREVLRLAKLNQEVARKGHEADEERFRLGGTSTLQDEVERHKSSSKEAVLHARYRDVNRPKTEQQLWEEQKIQSSSFRRQQHKDIAHGPSEADKGTADYDLVFESTIDFIAGAVEEGQNIDELLLRMAKKKEEEKRIAGKQNKSKVDSSLSKKEKLAAVRRSLPIYAYRDDLLAAIAEHQVLVVVGETGSGKTTQIPQYLHEVGYTKLGKIGCTQPRRVAAMSVAKRVSEEMNVELGQEVGYSIRFEDCTSEKTIVKYMTDGMLLREFMTEPDLASYSVMIIDEAHERTLHTDVLLALIKDVARFREDIKIIISSATVDAEKFSAYFDDAPIYNIPGRRYPVTYYHTTSPEADFVEASVVAALQIHVSEPLPGDILIFLTGQEEIEAAAETLQERVKAFGSRMKELVICPIYATLPAEQQTKIFEETPPNARKVIIATNIAETSLTIEGIVHVIDCGYCKQNSYNSRTGVESLQITPISKASAIQRAGRAGRTGPGKCFRLYTEWAFKHDLPDNTTPEIQRVNLNNVVLMLKSLGIDDLVNFDFMDPPPKEALMRALESLYALGALNSKGQLTQLGRRMAEFPCDPQLSKMLISSEKYGCGEELLTVAAMLDVNNSIFYRPKDKALMADAARAAFGRGGHGDHIVLMEVYNNWRDSGYSAAWCYENFIQVKSMKRARDIRDQLEALCERTEVKLQSSSDIDAITKGITAGFFANVARLDKGGNYRTLRQGHSVTIHPSSSLAKVPVPPKWILFHELVETTKEFVRTVTVVKPEWLSELAPHFYSANEIASMIRKMPADSKKKNDEEEE